MRFGSVFAEQLHRTQRVLNDAAAVIERAADDIERAKAAWYAADCPPPGWHPSHG